MTATEDHPPCASSPSDTPSPVPPSAGLQTNSDPQASGEPVTEGGREQRHAHASRKLQVSEEHFRLLVDSVVDYAIFMLDPDGVVSTWNAGAQRLKGYEADEIIGRHYSTFYTDEGRDARLPERLLTTARHDGTVSDTGWRVRRDGTMFWADVVITALYEDGQLAGFAKVTRDRTEDHLREQERATSLERQRAMVARLEELHGWHRTFVNSIVHDLQTPLTAIAGFSEILRDPDRSDEERQECLRRIISNTSSLQQLIDNLRVYSHLDSGRLELALEGIELRVFVDEVLADMQPVLGERHVDVDIPGVEVVADRTALGRVLRNLLANAAQHTPEGTPVHLRARHADGHVRVEVRDEGEGIAERVLPRIFERFQSGGAGGTGLGLPIAKEYVELHGGTIGVVRSDARGTTLRFTLPTP